MSSLRSNSICTSNAGRVDVIGTDDPRVGIRLPPDAITTQQAFTGRDKALLFVVGPDADPQAVARAAVAQLPAFLAEIANPALTSLRAVARCPESRRSASREELMAIIERAHAQLEHAICGKEAQQ